VATAYVMPRTMQVSTFLLLLTAVAAVKEEVKALRDTRLQLCRAIVSEMHTEIHKHSLRKDGEDDIYECVCVSCPFI
jgi:hypothetical protein